MSTSRTMPGGKANRAELPKGSNGRALCRWCSIEVPPGRSTFCSEWCVNEWRLRTNPGYLREKVFGRDHGVCALCRKNTVEEHLRLKRARGERRLERLALWGIRTPRRSLWEADHVLPVAEGGGECDLDNLRTLCLLCHRKVTHDLRVRLKASRGERASPTG